MTAAPSTSIGSGELDAAAVGVPSAFHRLWRGFMAARIGVAFVLFALLGLHLALQLVPTVRPWLVAVCAAYVAASVAVRLFTRPLSPGGAFDPHWVFTVGVDLVALSTLNLFEAGGLNYSPLYALPVLTAAVLGSRLLALGTAAGATLLLLVEAWLSSLQVTAEATGRFVQAGLTGTGYFLLALLAHQLATRLAREEYAARRSQMAARAQAQVNELVIEALGDGVLVVSPDCGIHAANPAARQLLGWQARETPVSLVLASRPGWQPLADIARRTFARQAPQLEELTLEPLEGERLQLQVRTRLTPPQDFQSETLCVMFLEDLRETEARLRTEKLAAMGRMSAAVAHEIRNPLAAIAQANALLEEELSDAGQRQLSAMVRQNSQRLAHIVDEILNLARAQQQGRAPAWLDLDLEVRTACEEWSRQMHVGDRLSVAPGRPGVRVLFEQEHLRRVLVNLLDNALRYASTRAGAIRVSTGTTSGTEWLRVWSDGAPLEQAVQRHLFEPFFSSESRSTGLGLYICRELCERHGAAISYRRAGEGNEFQVTMRPQSAAASGAFDTIRA